jgi:hypothetical protein
VINKDNSLEKIQRNKDWYGNRKQKQDKYILSYDYFPNPVVKTSNDETVVRPKFKDDNDRFFNLFDRKETTITIPISEYEKKEQENTYRGSIIGLHNVFNNVVHNSNYTELVSALVPNNVENDLLAVLRFVQQTEYREDYNSTNKFGYVRYPVETLVDGVGDCKDTTVLFTALTNALGVATGYASFIGHVAPLIPKHMIPDELLPNPKATVPINNTDYFIVETTAPNEIGHTVKDKNDLIFTYTDEITTFNIENIPTHIKQGIEKMRSKNTTKKA